MFEWINSGYMKIVETLAERLDGGKIYQLRHFKLYNVFNVRFRFNKHQFNNQRYIKEVDTSFQVDTTRVNGPHRGNVLHHLLSR